MVEKAFITSKIKNTVPWSYVISDLNGEPITRSFYEKELQEINRKKFRIEKLTKRKGDKLYFKWKRYDNSFNSWINKKRHWMKFPLIKMNQYFAD